MASSEFLDGDGNVRLRGSLKPQPLTSPLSADLDAGSHKIVDLAAGAAPGEAVTFEQLPAALLLQRTVQVSAAQILALGSVDLVPAPGPNVLAMPVLVVVHLHAGTPYATGAKLALGYRGGFGFSAFAPASADILDQATDVSVFWNGWTVGQRIPADAINTAIALGPGGATPTGGDGTLTAVADYVLANVAA